MATGSDSDFAKATKETTVEKFRHWKLLKHNYPSEIKSQKRNLRLQFTGWSYFFFLQIYFGVLGKDQ